MKRVLRNLWKYGIPLIAWAGFLASLNYVGNVAADGLTRDRSHSETYLLHVKDDPRGIEFESFGLTYKGTNGTWLAVAESAIVIIGLVLVLVRPVVPRRIGVVLLAAWMLLWLGNAVAVLIIYSHWVFWLHMAFVGPPSLCALIYLFRRWCETPKMPKHSALNDLDNEAQTPAATRP